MDELFILTNSPGEVSGWVRPVVSELTLMGFAAKVSLVLLPCQYASGMEAKCGKEIVGAGSVFTFKEMWSSAAAVKGAKRLVLQLGGDPFFGALLSAKMRCAWMIYTARPRWMSRVDHYFVPDAAAEERFTLQGVRRDRVTRVGNLVFDSAPECHDPDEARAVMGLKEGEEAVSFMAGSRPFEYRDGFAFFSCAAMEFLRKHPNYHAFLPVAPTVTINSHSRTRQRGLWWKGHRSGGYIMGGPGIWVHPGAILRLSSLYLRSHSVHEPQADNITQCAAA